MLTFYITEFGEYLLCNTYNYKLLEYTQNNRVVYSKEKRLTRRSKEKISICILQSFGGGGDCGMFFQDLSRDLSSADRFNEWPVILVLGEPSLIT